MTDTPTYHRGSRDFGTGYDMLKRIEEMEAEIERLRALVGFFEEGGKSLEEVRAALTQEGEGNG